MASRPGFAGTACVWVQPRMLKGGAVIHKAISNGLWTLCRGTWTSQEECIDAIKEKLSKADAVFAWCARNA